MLGKYYWIILDICILYLLIIDELKYLCPHLLLVEIIPKINGIEAKYLPWARWARATVDYPPQRRSSDVQRGQ